MIITVEKISSEALSRNLTADYTFSVSNTVFSARWENSDVGTADVEEIHENGLVFFGLNLHSEHGKKAWEWAQINLGFYFSTEKCLRFEAKNASVELTTTEVVSPLDGQEDYIRICVEDKAKAALFKLFWL